MSQSMEQRRYPRIDVNIPAQLTPPGSAPINVRLLDTSSSVLKIECNSVARNLITPSGQWTQGGHPLEVKVAMCLPNGNGEISAVCTIAFARRVAKDRYQFGLRYLALSTPDYERLTAFIDSRIHR